MFERSAPLLPFTPEAVSASALRPRFWLALCLVLLAILAAMPSTSAQAQTYAYANLPVVKPVVSCAALANVDVSPAAGARVTMRGAELLQTKKGPFCKVTGTIAPAIQFEVDLPMERWTQRYIQGGCGGLCGMTTVSITHASACAPALNGEFVMSGDDMGHEAPMGSPQEADFGRDPQRRIDFAYRGNHLTVLVTKALIKAFYGQGPRYSYFVGCSDGGREALIEAQRYPGDFDGVSAGAPVALFQVQNSFYHSWTMRANRRADGTSILLDPKTALIHAAVLKQCDTQSGVQDGLLEEPRACHFAPRSIQCPAGASDTSRCLTTEEVGVAEKLYGGATDGAGHTFTFGAEPGSEQLWHLPRSEAGSGASADQSMASRMLANIILPEPVAPDVALAELRFDEASLARVSELAPLYNGANTDLKPFAAHGGKLLLWHGLEDTSVTPGVSIAYYQGVQKFMGAAATDRFLRLFLVPGLSHCFGGEGYTNIEVLAPLMAWVERGAAPKAIFSGKSPPPEGGPSSSGAARPGGTDASPPTGAGGPPRGPVAIPMPPLVATRPIYAFPYIARYTGKGDLNDAASYVAVKSPTPVPQSFPADAIRLIGPDNQKFYHVEQGKLVNGHLAIGRLNRPPGLVKGLCQSNCTGVMGAAR